MVAPSGEQFEIAGAGYRAVVTESGAALRVLEYADRSLVDGFGEQDMSSGGRGQLLAPWPNRVEDGSYDFGGRSHQLGLTEPSRRTKRSSTKGRGAVAVAVWRMRSATSSRSSGWTKSRMARPWTSVGES